MRAKGMTLFCMPIVVWGAAAASLIQLTATQTVGVALTILTDLVLLPVLLSYTKLRNLPRKRAYRLRQLTQFDKLWTVLARFSKPVPAAIILVIGIAAWFFAERHGEKVMIGDAQMGVAELRPDARYNRDAILISDKFALGVDILNVIAEAAPSACTMSYPTMELVDRFAWHLGNVEGVAQVMTLPMAAKIVNAGWNEGNIRWRVLPRDADTLRLATQGFETDTGLLNADCSAMPIMAFLTDHRATTIDRVVGAVKQFRDDNKAWAGGTVNLREVLAEKEAAGIAPEPGEPFVNLRLATGNVGVMAAINDEVKAKEFPILAGVFAAVSIMCLLTFRSLLGTILVVLPLALVSILVYALMALLGIGLKVATLPVVALGVGIGVDYGIYLYSRMQEYLHKGQSVREAYERTMRVTGASIIFTGITLAIGVGTWAFSALKFQADMGILLAFMFLVNVLGAIFLLPALGAWLIRGARRA